MFTSYWGQSGYDLTHVIRRICFCICTLLFFIFKQSNAILYFLNFYLKSKKKTYIFWFDSITILNVGLHFIQRIYITKFWKQNRPRKNPKRAKTLMTEFFRQRKIIRSYSFKQEGKLKIYWKSTLLCLDNDRFSKWVVMHFWFTIFIVSNHPELKHKVSYVQLKSFIILFGMKFQRSLQKSVIVIFLNV